jgi:5'-deoxynucleotidase YfbR-like HD superfamily hydrolase
MNTSETINLLIRSNLLKRIQRSGWITAGVHKKTYETVAAHSWGTCFISLIITKQLKKKGYEVDLGIVLELATVHDLPEIVITDIPYSAIEVAGHELEQAKKAAEKKAVESIFAPFEEIGVNMIDGWKKSLNPKSIESRIVAGADIIDMLVHAISLEKSGVSPSILDSFFSKSYQKIKSLEITEIIEMYDILLKKHRQNFHQQKKFSDQID